MILKLHVSALCYIITGLAERMVWNLSTKQNKSAKKQTSEDSSFTSSLWLSLWFLGVTFVAICKTCNGFCFSTVAIESEWQPLLGNGTIVLAKKRKQFHCNMFSFRLKALLSEQGRLLLWKSWACIIPAKLTYNIKTKQKTQRAL